jgi:hypothetical protein
VVYSGLWPLALILEGIVTLDVSKCIDMYNTPLLKEDSHCLWQMPIADLLLLCAFSTCPRYIAQLAAAWQPFLATADATRHAACASAMTCLKPPQCDSMHEGVSQHRHFCVNHKGCTPLSVCCSLDVDGQGTGNCQEGFHCMDGLQAAHLIIINTCTAHRSSARPNSC